MKYLKINPMKNVQNCHTENNKTLLRQIKENKDIVKMQFSWTRKFSIINMSVLPQKDP